MSLKVVGGLGKTFKLAMFLIALFFSLPALGLILFFSQRRWMMPKHILINYKPKTSINMGPKCVQVAPRCVWAPSNTSWSGKWAIQKKNRSMHACMYARTHCWFNIFLYHYPWTYGLAIEVMSKFEMPETYSFLPKSLPQKKRTAQFSHIAKFQKKC